MSHKSPAYGSTIDGPKSIAAFKKLRCARQYTKGYEPPTNEEVKQLAKLMNWTGGDVATLTGVENKEGRSRTVRRWMADPSTTNYRAIPYSAWRLLLIYAGVVSMEKDVESSNLGNVAE